jgi:hypothetical protein
LLESDKQVVVSVSTQAPLDRRLGQSPGNYYYYYYYLIELKVGFCPVVVLSHDKFVFYTAKDITDEGLRLLQDQIPMLL